MLLFVGFSVGVAAVAPPTITLRNGVKMPMIAAGVGGLSDDDAATAVSLALSSGFTAIDTAADYKNFAGVARALKNVSRESYFITSKVPGCGVPTQGLSPPCFNNTLRAGEQDVRALGVKIDLMLLHFPPLLGCKIGSKSCAKIQEQWRALEQMYNVGEAVNAIGVSNYCQECLECVAQTAEVMPQVVQMEFHVGMSDDPAGLRSYCKSKGIVHQAYSPLGHGTTLKSDVVQRIASRTNRTAAQVALRWVSQVGSPFVTRSLNREHLLDDLDTFSWSLADEDLAALSAADGPACLPEAPGGCCSAAEVN